MSSGSLRDDTLAVPVSKAELAADAAETRQLVAEDIQALKEHLTVDRLKDRALDAAERSVETVALRALRRLKGLPSALATWSRNNPKAAAAAGAGVAWLAWRMVARRRKPRLFD